MAANREIDEVICRLRTKALRRLQVGEGVREEEERVGESGSKWK